MSEFLKQYGTAEQCHTALVASRWPEGFVCPHCGETHHSTFIHDGRQHWQCQ
ncbi:MAG: transposase, partial [Candidatus Nitrotoga sp.]